MMQFEIPFSAHPLNGGCGKSFSPHSARTFLVPCHQPRRTRPSTETTHCYPPTAGTTRFMPAKVLSFGRYDDGDFYIPGQPSLCASRRQHQPAAATRDCRRAEPSGTCRRIPASLFEFLLGGGTGNASHQHKHCRPFQQQVSDAPPSSSYCDDRHSPSFPSSRQSRVTNSRMAGEKDNDGNDGRRQEAASSHRPLWTRSISLRGFSPNEIDVKVRDEKVYVRACRESLSSPGSCLSRMEVRHAVSLPGNVDQQSLACSLTSDGTLVLCASLTEQLQLDNKADQLQALGHKGEKKVDTTEDMPTEFDQEEQDSKKKKNIGEVLECHKEDTAKLATENQEMDNGEKDERSTIKSEELDQEEQNSMRNEKVEEVPDCPKEDTDEPVIANQEMDKSKNVTKDKKEESEGDLKPASPSCQCHVSETQMTMTEKSNNSQPEVSCHRPQWTRSISLPGFIPNEIKVKLRDDKVYVQAHHEGLDGHNSCLSRMEVKRTVKLPANVDKHTLACSLKHDGTLVLRASLTTKLHLEDKADKLQALEHENEKKVDASEDKPATDDHELSKESHEKDRKEEREDADEGSRHHDARSEDGLTTEHQEPLPNDTFNPETNSDHTNDKKSQEDMRPLNGLTVPSGGRKTHKIPDDSTADSRLVDTDATPPIKRSGDEVHGTEKEC